MRLSIEVRSGQTNCGLPQGPENGGTTGRSFHSFTIVHQLVGNNDAFVPQMYEALVRLSDGEDNTIAIDNTDEDNPVIRLTVDDLQQMYLTGIAVQMEYEHLVRVMDNQRQAALAVG